MAGSGAYRARTCLVHRLLRARDWQDRPQLAAVCDWWREGGAGVCGLVGIGGAGKTAIAERLLRLLPGVTEEGAGLEKDASLPVPDGLFVFSFYGAPNPELFFDTLYDWLVRDFGVPDRRRTTEQGERLQASASQVIDTLANLRSVAQASSLRNLRILLVLDGMEKVQDDGSRSGVFGHIEDGGLREFLVRGAAGWMPGVSVLVTTRFVPEDVEYERERGAAPHYRRIDVEEIPEEACIQLLRGRGVRGGDDALGNVARECGRLALMVDLAASYLVHFCDGDPQAPLEMPTSEELKRLAAQTRDRRLRYVAEQSARFAKLAQRYRDALSRSDAAALALLERICLFRLGVPPDTLASIFTGEGKESISGADLARLCRDELESKLALLVDMRLIESSGRQSDSRLAAQDSPRYNVHPAIRDGFLAGLDPESARLAHDAAGQAMFGTLPWYLRRHDIALWEPRYPCAPPTLDLLEDTIYHTLQAGDAQNAFHIYLSRMGGYKNLGWRLGAYERGERICRAFAAGGRAETVPIPDGLSQESHACFINEWALYLKELGRLAAAAHWYEQIVQLLSQQEDWKNASAGSGNLAEVRLVSGRLEPALRAAEEGVRLAERAEKAERRSKSHLYRAHARDLRGQTAAALADFRDALQWQHQHEGKYERALYGLGGLWHALLLARLGRNQEATRLTQKNHVVCLAVVGEGYHAQANVRLLLADLAREHGDLSAAADLLNQAHAWALARDAKEPLCWAELVRARIKLEHTRDEQRSNLLHDARRAIEEGLRIARECGFGIYHIDLLLERARLHLLLGDAEAAEADVRTALFEGHKPPSESGLPTLLAAADPECGYAWGMAAGRHLLAEALLLQAAQRLGSRTYKPRPPKTPPQVPQLIKSACAELDECIRVRKRIQDPKLAETQQVLRSVEGGTLTPYPLEAEMPRQPPSPEGSLPRHIWTVEDYYRAKEFYEKRGLAFNPALDARSPAAYHVIAEHQLRALQAGEQKAVKPKTETKKKRFRVALSFPGEHRNLVAQVGAVLSQHLGQDKVFYDKFYEAELARPNLDTYLQHIYHDESDLLVVFICQDYEKKEWCGLEWRAIRDLIKKKEAAAIMPVRVGEGDVSGLFSIDGYVDAKDRSAAELAALVIERLRINESAGSGGAHRDHARGEAAAAEFLRLVAGKWHLQFTKGGRPVGEERCRIDAVGGYYLLDRRPGELWCEIQDVQYDPATRRVTFIKVKKRGKQWRHTETLALLPDGKRMEGHTDDGRSLVYTRMEAMSAQSVEAERAGPRHLRRP